MRELQLQDAAWEIVSAARFAKAENERPPFFFLVGAGLSAPYVPLARDVIAHCRERAEAEREPVERTYTDTLDEYSYWFERAYPQAVQRRRYLESIIRPKERDSVTRAALRLAHVVGQGDIARLVVTPNFDESVTMAFRLFGTPCVVCDHPATALRIDPERDVVQVVHVHGTYWFYDCCNLAGEVHERAEIPPMSALLDLILSRRSPIVVGYGGWERDVFMTALRRRLGNRLPVNLYWFCHTRSDAESLPSWLTGHQDVVIVVAEDGKLPAMEILESLIREAGIPTPHLIENPMLYFADLLDGIVPDEEKVTGYVFGEVIDTLREAADRPAPLPTPLTDIRAAVREARHADVVILIAGLPDEPSLNRHATEIANALDTALDMPFVGVDRGTQQEAILRALAMIGHVPSARDRDRLEASLRHLAVTIHVLDGDIEEAGRLVRELVKRFGDSSEEEVVDQIACAMCDYGDHFVDAGDLQAARKVLAEMEHLFSAANSWAKILRRGVEEADDFETEDGGHG